MLKRIISIVLVVLLTASSFIVQVSAEELYSKSVKGIKMHQDAEAWCFTMNGNYLFVHTNKTGVELVDISKPDSPVLVDPQPELYSQLIGTTDQYSSLSVSGNYLYVAYTSGDKKYQLTKVDITNPLSPVSTVTVDISRVYDIKIKDNFAYVALKDGGIAIYDVSDNKLELKNTIKVKTLMIYKEGNYIYSANNTGLDIIKLKDAFTLESKYSLNLTEKNVFINYMLVNGNNVYLASGDTKDSTKNKIVVVDASSPAQLASAKLFDYIPDQEAFPPIRMMIDGSHMYVSGKYQTKMEVLDLAKPLEPKFLLRLPLGGSYGMDKKDNNMYIANRANGIVVYKYNNVAASVTQDDSKPEPTAPPIQGKSIFEDVVDHWAKADIEMMATKGIIKGMDDKHFAPESDITRAEFLTLVIRAIKLKTVMFNNGFKDVATGEWYSDTVQTAKDNGLIDSGMIIDNNFKPEQPINREEMTSLIINAFNNVAEQKAVAGIIEKYQDKDQISQWALEYVKAADALGIIKGVSDSQFAPMDRATRAQSAVIIKRLLDKIGAKLNDVVSQQPVDVNNVDSISATDGVWDIAPAITRVSEAVAPGRLLSINGNGIFPEGIQVVVKPVNGTTDKVPPADATPLEIVQTDVKGYFVAAKLPASSKPGVYDLWVKNKFGWSKPTFLNNASALYISEYEVFEGLQIKLVGRNLDLKEFGGATSDTKVRLNDDKGNVFPLNIDELNPFAVTFKVVGVPLGTYQVEVKNQESAPWSRIVSGQTLKVIEAGPDPLGLGVAWAKDYKWDKKYNVTEFGATANDDSDDTKAIQSTIDKAKEMGGGVVFIPNGKYYSATLELPADIILMGEDKFKTELLYSGGKGNFIKLKDDGLVEGRIGVAKLNLKLKNQDIAPDVFLALSQGWGAEVKDYRLRTLTRVFVYEVNVEAPQYLDVPFTLDDFKKLNGRAIGGIFTGDERFVIMNSSFKSMQGAISNSYINKYVTFKNNTFDYRRGHIGASALYTFYENNQLTGQRDIDLKESQIHGFTVTTNAYLYNNTMKDIGFDHSVNHGEIMMAEIPGRFYNFGTVISAIGTKLQVKSYDDLVIPVVRHSGLGAFIIDGHGIGQYRKVLSIEGDTMTLDKPWDIMPDKTSKFSFVIMNENVTYYHNTGINNAGAIVFYGNGINSVAADNVVTESSGVYGVGFYVPGLNRFNPMYFIRIDRNVITDNSVIAETANGSYVGVMAAGKGGYGLQCFGIDIRDNVVKTDKIKDAPGIIIFDKDNPNGGLNTKNVIIENNKLENLMKGIRIDPTGIEGTVLSGNEFKGCIKNYDLPSDTKYIKVLQ